MEWFRFYDEVLDDPKVQRLPAALFRDWINVLCLCNRNDPRGVLPSLDDVAFGLRYTNTKAQNTIKKLHEAGLLVTEKGVTYPNGWAKRQRVSDNVAKRVAEHRARKAAEGVIESDTCNVTSNTPSDTAETLPHVRATDTETDTEAELTTASAVVEGAPAPKPKPKAKRATQVPETWMPSDSTREWAKGEGFQDAEVNGQILRFVDHWRGKGETRKDWDATFRNWMRNAREWGHLHQPKAAPQAKSTDKITSVEQLFAEGTSNEPTGYPENSYDFESSVASEWPGQGSDSGMDGGASGAGLRAIAGGRR